MAIERGVYFEVCYGGAVGDSSCRRNLIANTISLSRITKGKNIIISSQALDLMELRRTADIVNL